MCRRGLRIDRLLQRRNVRIAPVDAVAAIAGQEDEGNAAGHQRIRHGIDRLAPDVQIEDGAVDGIRPRGLQGRRNRTDGTDHRKSQIGQRFFQHRGHEGSSSTARMRLPAMDRDGGTVVSGRSGPSATATNRSVLSIRLRGMVSNAEQALPAPFEGRAAAQLLLDPGGYHLGAETPPGGLLGGRPARFGPAHDEGVRLDLPAEREAALRARTRRRASRHS